MKKLLLILLPFTVAFAGNFTRKQLFDYYTWLKCSGCPGIYYELSSWVYGTNKKPENYILLSHYYDKTYQGEVTDEAFEYSEALQKGFPAITLNRSLQSFGTIPVCSLATLNESTLSPFSINFTMMKVNQSTREVTGNLTIEVGQDYSGNCNISLITARDSVESIKLQSNGFNASKGHPLFGKGLKLPVYHSKMIAHNYIFPKYGKVGVIPEQCKKGDIFTVPFTYKLTESDPLKHIYLVAWINKDSAEVLQAEIAPLEREKKAINQYYRLKEFEKGAVNQWAVNSIYKAGTRVTDGRIVYNTSYESSMYPDITGRPENEPGLLSLNWMKYWTAVGFIKGGVSIAPKINQRRDRQLRINNGTLTLSDKDTWLRIFNLSGQQLHHLSLQNKDTKTIDLNTFNLPAGPYIISIKQEAQVYSQAIIIQ